MDPTISIQNVFRYVLGVDTVNGVSNILPRGDDETKGNEDDDGNGVMQPEDWRVDVDVADFDQVLQATEYVQHLKAPVVGRSASGGAEPEANISTPPPRHTARDQQSNSPIVQQRSFSGMRHTIHTCWEQLQFRPKSLSSSSSF